jgi:hypothetical protein
MVATAGAGDAQVEGLEVFFDAQAHRNAANLGLRFSLPPCAILAQTPIGCCHNCNPFQGGTSPEMLFDLDISSSWSFLQSL